MTRLVPIPKHWSGVGSVLTDDPIRSVSPLVYSALALAGLRAHEVEAVIGGSSDTLTSGMLSPLRCDVGLLPFRTGTGEHDVGLLIRRYERLDLSFELMDGVGLWSSRQGRQEALRLDIGGALPATLVASLPGLALDRLVDHPLLGGGAWIVANAWTAERKPRRFRKHMEAGGLRLTALLRLPDRFAP